MDIFNLQSQYHDKIALITECDEIISYGQLNSYVDKIKTNIKAKSLVLILASNNVETVAFYLATFMADSAVILSSESINVQSLIELYRPRYIVKRKNTTDLFKGYEVLYNFLNYELLETNVDYEIDSGIALLLSTSGSTATVAVDV